MYIIEFHALGKFRFLFEMVEAKKEEFEPSISFSLLARAEPSM
jgi:hypothetical protein